MKVLHVIPSLSMVHGGPSRAIRCIEGALLDSGSVSLLVATTNDDGKRRSTEDPIGRPLSQDGRLRIYFRKRADFYTFAPGLAVWLWRNIRDFDVCHVHALFSFPSTAATVMALLRGVPLVVRPLGTLNDYGIRARRPLLKRLSLALIERPVLRRAAAVHCTSVDEERQVRDIEPTAQTAVIPLAVEAQDAFTLDQAMAALPEYAGKRIVLFLSRLDPKKNVEALLDAWATLVPEADALLVVAGSGEAQYVQSLVDQVARLGIADRVSWTGYVDGPEKSALFRLAKVFVLPSLSENFGIAVAEALAAGLPCVVTSGVALAADIAEADAGSVVAPLPATLAHAMSKYLHDDQFRASQSARARLFASRAFSPKIMAKRLLDLYGSIAHKPTRVH